MNIRTIRGRVSIRSYHLSPKRMRKLMRWSWENSDSACAAFSDQITNIRRERIKISWPCHEIFQMRHCVKSMYWNTTISDSIQWLFPTPTSGNPQIVAKIAIGKGFFISIGFQVVVHVIGRCLLRVQLWCYGSGVPENRAWLTKANGSLLGNLLSSICKWVWRR